MHFDPLIGISFQKFLFFLKQYCRQYWRHYYIVPKNKLGKRDGIVIPKPRFSRQLFYLIAVGSSVTKLKAVLAWLFFAHFYAEKWVILKRTDFINDNDRRNRSRKSDECDKC
jgi:hypothetical protein